MGDEREVCERGVKIEKRAHVEFRSPLARSERMTYARASNEAPTTINVGSHMVVAAYQVAPTLFIDLFRRCGWMYFSGAPPYAQVGFSVPGMRFGDFSVQGIPCQGRARGWECLAASSREVGWCTSVVHAERSTPIRGNWCGADANFETLSILGEFIVPHVYGDGKEVHPAQPVGRGL